MCATANSCSSGATTRPARARTSCRCCAKPNARALRSSVIDPRRTLTARSADQHIQPRPATDGALALGLLHVIFEEGLHDEEWLEATRIGWRELRERAASTHPSAWPRSPACELRRSSRWRGATRTTKPALLKFCRWHPAPRQRRPDGARAALPAGGGGQYRHARRRGVLQHQRLRALGWEAIGHASECPPTPRIVNMNRIGAALTGRGRTTRRSNRCSSSTPTRPASTPNTSRDHRRGLQRDDLFTVVHELFMTDTAALRRHRAAGHQPTRTG